MWQLCGGHVTLGSLVVYLIARIFYECRRNFLAAEIVCDVVWLTFWFVCDSIWGLG
jgi:hypothetical protein